MTAYYNEHDKFAAEWLRQLIRENLITPGEVDERDIQQVTASDLRGFTQCHFFAGIGVWSYALRCAGWPEDEPVWTGSCPCQPFSVSGKRARASDERHLWPVWFPLIRESRPEHVFGEQVASDDGLAWLDLVSTDLEGQDYTIGTVDTPACGFGAPMRRQRLYFVAHPEHDGRDRSQRLAAFAHRNQPRQRIPDGDSAAGIVGNAWSAGRGARREHDDSHAQGERRDTAERREHRSDSDAPSSIDGAVVNAESDGWQQGRPESEREQGRLDASQSGLVNGFWRTAEWLWCRDKKYRPVEAGTFPLAHGVKNRVGKLRGYGNALVAPQAQAFVEAYLETSHEQTTGVPGRLTR